MFSLKDIALSTKGFLLIAIGSIILLDALGILAISLHFLIILFALSLIAAGCYLVWDQVAAMIEQKKQ